MFRILDISNYSSFPVLSVNKSGKETDESPLSIEDKGVSRKESLTEIMGEKVKSALNKLRNFAKQNPGEAGAVTGTVGFLAGAAIGANERANELEKELQKIRGIPEKAVTLRTNLDKTGPSSTEAAIIAQDALATIEDMETHDFVRELGNKYLDLILEKKLNNTEAFLARIVRTNTDPTATHIGGEAAAELQKVAFKILATGAAGQGNEALFQAMGEIYHSDHLSDAVSRRIGNAFLQEILKNCNDQKEAKLGKFFQEVIAMVPEGDDHDISRHQANETAVAIQKIALDNLKKLETDKSPAPIVHLLPAIALQLGAAADGYGYSKLQCKLGRVFLDAITADSPNPTVTLLAQTARKFSEKEWRTDEFNAQREALKKIRHILAPEEQEPVKPEKKGRVRDFSSFFSEGPLPHFL
ncbi:MAG: hypothetical protein HYU64_20125 [Armatimonadetes bacterium]|nr:hypothetical protein [Armatimonadota bacterium]